MQHAEMKSTTANRNKKTRQLLINGTHKVTYLGQVQMVGELWVYFKVQGRIHRESWQKVAPAQYLQLSDKTQCSITAKHNAACKPVTTDVQGGQTGNI